MDKKKKNTGTPYEIVTQGIWQAINNQREVATVIVQHDVTLQGLLTSHQIDVYWEFEYTVLHKNLTGPAYSLGFLQFEYWLSATLRNR